VAGELRVALGHLAEQQVELPLAASPLRSLPNVVLTPHVGGSTRRPA